MRFLFVISWLICSHVTLARTIVAGVGQPVKTLTAAVQLARDGDTIRLRNGVYKEGRIVITRPVTVLGEGNTILDGDHKQELLVISGSHVTIKKLQFHHAGYSALNDYAAVKLIDASYVLLEDNLVYDAYFAFHISNAAYCTIRNNRIVGIPKTEQLTGNGIHLWKSNHALIEGNKVTCNRDGIYFEFVTESVIRKNLSEKNIRYGLHFMFSHGDHYIENIFRNNGAGVAVMYSKHVTMERNHFEANWGASSYGLLLKEITDSHIVSNLFLKNTTGIYMEGASRIEIERNIFRNNGWAVKVQASCDDNVFHHNNFFGNSFDLATNGTMVLNKLHNNYWDKYEGYDIDRNGVGDVPYHPVSMYSMIVEQTPGTMILMRSFMVTLLDKAEKAIPSLTPENLVDRQPMIKPLKI